MSGLLTGGVHGVVGMVRCFDARKHFFFQGIMKGVWLGGSSTGKLWFDQNIYVQGLMTTNLI
jgi:hypothetical protein